MMPSSLRSAATVDLSRSHAHRAASPAGTLASGSIARRQVGMCNMDIW